MDDFDFSDYTFSAIISIFAAIIGLAFPFILSMVHRFQDTYKTDSVIEWFANEKAYRHFLWWLKFSIPVMVLMPFCLLIVNGNEYLSLILLTIQSAVAATLMYKLVLLYYLIIDYSVPMKLAQRVNADEINKTVFLMLISDKNENPEAYQAAKNKVYGKITDFLGKLKGSNSEHLFSQKDMALAIQKILEATCDTSKYPSTSKDVTIVYYLYDNIFFKLRLSDSLLQMMWHALNGMVKSRNEIWLKGYWDAALQYAQTIWQELSKKKDLKQFKQMHFFYGALLLGAGYDDMLCYILSFRNVSPEPSILLPSKVDEVFQSLLDVGILKSEPFGLMKRYPMSFLPLDVRGDERIFSAFMDYMVLSLLVLPQNQSPYYINHGFSFSENLSKIELNNIHTLISVFKKCYKNKAKDFKKYLQDSDNYRDYSNKGLKTINGILSKCEEEINNIKANDVIDPQKINNIKQSLVDTYKSKTKPMFIGKEKCSDREETKAVLNVRFVLSPEQVMTRQYIPDVNFEDIVITSLLQQVYGNLFQIFLFNKPAVTYLIQYKDIVEAFERLNVDDNYILLNNGVSLWNYGRGRALKQNIIFTEDKVSFNGMEIRSMGSGNEEMYILKKTDVPYYIIEDMEAKSDLQLIDSESKLYWIEPTMENNLHMTLYQKIKFFYPLPFRYIKLNISYDISKGNYSLDKIQDIRNFVV